MDNPDQPPQEKTEQSDEKADWKCDIIATQAQKDRYADKVDAKPKTGDKSFQQK